MDKDTDDDGIEDGDEQAATVASFDGTTLVIDLAGGAPSPPGSRIEPRSSV